MLLKQIKFFVFLFFFSGFAYSACSPYKGFVTLNEAGKIGFVELKLLDTTIPSSVYQNWTVSICKIGSCSGDLSLPSSPPLNNAFIIVPTSFIPNNAPFDIIFEDENGDTIDYLSVGYTVQRDVNCTPPFDWDAAVSNSHDYRRNPDGTGEWGNAGSGNSGGETGGDTNNPGLPNLSVANITVNKGSLAVFDLILASPAPAGGVSVQYTTVDNTAIAGTHYTAQSGTATIAAGATSTTISIPTTANSPDNSVSFFLFLFDAVNASIVNHYPQATLESGPIAGLIGEWRFDELFWNGTNSEVTDSSGNDLHLTAFSSQTANSNPAIAGDPGTCAYGVFNGSISFIQRDDDTSTADSLLDIPDNLTVTTWINTNVIPTSGLKSILSKDENYEFHINTSGEIYWWWRWATLTTSGANITPGQWHHIAITWRSGEQVIYVDGIERARSARTGTLDINNDPLQVGQDLDIPQRFFDGFIDEVRIYENFLSAAEVNQVMNETHPCTTTGICTLTFGDSFPAAAYNNSTGTSPWSGDWIESDDNGSPTSGNVLVTGGELRMDDRPDSGGQPSLEREVDLTGFLSAFVTFELATSGNLEDSDVFEIAVSDDGGSSYTPLASLTNDFTGSYNYDLTPYMAINTRIRFRIAANYGGTNERIDIDNVLITGQKRCGPDHFRLIHDGSGINCLREAITIRAEDSSGNLINDYAGTVDLALSTNNGNWFVVDSSGNSADPAQGTLADTAGDNNGAALYQFNPADNGSVILYLENTQAETTNIAVSEGAVVDDNSEGNITFRPFGFVFSPAPVSTQIAGRPFNVTLTAAGQTPSQPQCGVIEEYTGLKSLNLWSNYALPITSPTLVSVNGTNIASNEAASAAQNVTFTNGITNLNVRYDDVGQISLHAKDQIGIGEPPSGSGDEIIGGISPFVVRPFGYDIQIAGSPYADAANDPVYTTASIPFNMTVRSVLWQAVDDSNNDGIPDPFIDTNGDGIPDSGGNLSDNGVTPNISLISGAIDLSPTAQVVTNSNGALSRLNVAFSDFPAPSAPSPGSLTFLQSWSEVGILQMNANTNSFMASGENVNGTRINIGRFIPNNFNVTITNNFAAQCGSFSYAGFANGTLTLERNGQTDAIEMSIQAVNAANAPTQNYAQSFAKLEAGSITLSGFDVTNSIAAPGTVNTGLIPAYLFDTLGKADNVTIPGINYQFNTLAAPFDLRVDINATDSDGVTSGTVNSSAVPMRLGRMRLIDSYGPEIADLEMRLNSEYFDGTNWILNTDDSCSSYIQTDASFDATSYTENLNAGETTIFSPAATQTLVNGVSNLANGIWFSAPGADNYGSVIINLNLAGQSWLLFDWDGDNSLDTTTGTLNFGYYRGSDRVIYWREI